MEVTLAVSTLGDRIGSIALPAPQDGLHILVLWQDPGGDAPAPLTRTDVTVVPLESRGAAASRNAALDRVDSGILQFWDDDMTPDQAGLETIWQHLRDHPALGFVTGLRRGLDRGTLPEGGAGQALSRTNIARTATPEIALVAEAVRGAGVRFDERFGLGATHPLGDEFVFLADCLKAGLQGWHLPVAVGTHPPQSTGDTWSDPKLLRARAAAIRRVFGPLGAIPAATAFALKHQRDMGFAAAVRFPWLCLGGRGDD